MKWLLILLLIGPDEVIQDRRAFSGFISKEQCENTGAAASAFYAEYGLIVKHICTTDV